MFCPSLLWFDHDVFYPCLPWSLHRSLKNHITTTVTRKQHWRLRVDTSHVYTFTKDYGVKKTSKHNVPCAYSLQRSGVSNHRRLDCLLSRLFRGDQRKHQSSAPLGFVRGIQRWPVDYPHKGPVTRKKVPFDDVIMFMGYPECTHRPLPDESRGQSEASNGSSRAATTQHDCSTYHRPGLSSKIKECTRNTYTRATD